MHVALLSWESLHSIAVGGVAVHTSELASALHRRDHDVHIFTRAGFHQTEYDCVDGVHYHRCACESGDDFVDQIERMNHRFISRLRETERKVGAPFGVVHGHDWLCVRGIVRAKTELGRRTLFTLHSTEYGRCGNQLWEGASKQIRDLEWEGIYVADRVICVSTALRQEAQTLYSAPSYKTHAIYNGINLVHFDTRVDRQAIRRAHGIDGDAPVVLFVGRLTVQKGPDLLLAAVPSVLATNPRAKFMFVGDGDLREPLEMRARATGVDHAVRFVGYRSGAELVGLFKSADIVCVPSRNEPFGIVVLEAWAARKAVVATRDGGPGEFVRHNTTGLTIRPEPDAIAAGLCAVLGDYGNAARLGRNGRREAAERFSWDQIAAQIEPFYYGVTVPREAANIPRPRLREPVHVPTRKPNLSPIRQQRCAVC